MKLVAERVLVYVQAMPVVVPHSIKKFQDLGMSEFSISHSSKVALSAAKSLGFHEIVALGFPPVLQESLARGATSWVSMPLCDDPLEQASFFPKNTIFPIIIGENSDWVFTGASLAGVLAESRACNLLLLEKDAYTELSDNSIVLVRDSGRNAGNIDVRRIKTSADEELNSQSVLGNSTLSRIEGKKTEPISGDEDQLVSLLTRKLNRILRR